MTEPMPGTDQVLSLAGAMEIMDRQESTLWLKARAILQRHGRRLKKVTSGTTTYRVSPTIGHIVDGTVHRFALAALADNDGKLTEETYVVVNDRFSTPLTIAKSADSKAPLYITDDINQVPIDIDDIDAVLDKIASEVAQQAENRRGEQKFAVICAVVVTLIGLICWGASSCDTSAPFLQERKAEVAAFEAAHPGHVLDGTRVEIGAKSFPLPPGGPDLALGVPPNWSADGLDIEDLSDKARSYGVTGGECRDVGYVPGSSHLLAETDAPVGIVTVSVGADGGTQVCAADPENRGIDAQWYSVLLQTQPNA